MDVNTLLGWLKIKPYIHSFEFFSLDKFYYGIKRNEWVGSFSDIKLCPLSTTRMDKLFALGSCDKEIHTNF